MADSAFTIKSVNAFVWIELLCLASGLSATRLYPMSEPATPQNKHYALCYAELCKTNAIPE